MTEVGTEAAVVGLAVSVTTSPPRGAAEVKVTVALDSPPPGTVEGLSTREDTPSGKTVRLADELDPPRVAVIVGFVVDVGWVVDTLNVACVDSGEILTDAGTVADGSVDDNTTSTPLLGAGALSVTVPVEIDPPATVCGLRETELTPIPRTVRDAVAIDPAEEAVRITFVSVDVVVVGTVNVTDDWPTFTCSVEGGIATG